MEERKYAIEIDVNVHLEKWFNEEAIVDRIGVYASDPERNDTEYLQEILLEYEETKHLDLSCSDKVHQMMLVTAEVMKNDRSGFAEKMPVHTEIKDYTVELECTSEFDYSILADILLQFKAHAVVESNWIRLYLDDRSHLIWSDTTSSESIEEGIISCCNDYLSQEFDLTSDDISADDHNWKIIDSRIKEIY